MARGEREGFGQAPEPEHGDDADREQGEGSRPAECVDEDRDEMDRSEREQEANGCLDGEG